MKKITISQFIYTRAILLILLIFIFIPIIWIISLSLKRPDEIFQSFLILFPKHISFFNFKDAFRYADEAIGIPFLKTLLNSTIITSVSAITATFLSAVTAYSFARFKFKGKETTFTVLLSSIMIPVQILLIPLYLMINRFNLLNNFFAVILPYIAIGIPFSTLILRTFFEEIPKEMSEAASIDGASDIRIFFMIYLPLSKASIATVIILLFLSFWNEFLYAFVFLQKPNVYTVTVAISQIGGAKYVIPWGTYAAAIIISTLPVLMIFIIFQKWFTRGIIIGAVKG